jgi:hypothetical protein
VVDGVRLVRAPPGREVGAVDGLVEPVQRRLAASLHANEYYIIMGAACQEANKHSLEIINSIAEGFERNIQVTS